MLAWFKKNPKPVIFLLILILITYGNALNNAFLSDDLAEIVNNPNIGKFGTIFSHVFGYIRPFLYWLLYSIFGLNQIAFRFSNFLFHIGSVFLVYAILQKIYPKRFIALIAASIFAIHPAYSEAVVWISGGMYPQYAFFFLLSFFLYLNKEVKKYYIFSIISFLFAFMSHPQMPLALVFIFPFWEFCFGSFKRNFKKTLPFFGVTLLFVLVSFASLPERTNTLQTVNYQERGIDNIFVLIPVAISSYFELLFFPKTLTLYHSELAFGPLNFGLRIIFTLIFFGVIIYGFKKNKNIFFWSLFFLLALAPTLTPFRLNWVVAERYLYLSSIGIIVLFSLGLEKLESLFKIKKLSLIILVIILGILSFRTILRNIDWKNEDNLWIATGKTSPSSPNTHNNLGDVYGRWGDKQKSLQEFQRAIELKPNYADAYHNAGNVYRELGQMDKALEYYQKAATLNPNLWQSYQNIAAIYFEAKQYDKALEYMQKAIQINPNINLVNNLGVVYLAKGDKEKAKEVFKTVLAADPQNQFATQGLAEAEKSLNDSSSK